jgi:hypothetical protein
LDPRKSAALEIGQEFFITLLTIKFIVYKLYPYYPINQGGESLVYISQEKQEKDNTVIVVGKEKGTKTLPFCNGNGF